VLSRGDNKFQITDEPLADGEAAQSESAPPTPSGAATPEKAEPLQPGPDPEPQPELVIDAAAAEPAKPDERVAAATREPEPLAQTTPPLASPARAGLGRGGHWRRIGGRSAAVAALALALGAIVLASTLGGRQTEQKPAIADRHRAQTDATAERHAERRSERIAARRERAGKLRRERAAAKRNRREATTRKRAPRRRSAPAPAAAPAMPPAPEYVPAPRYSAPRSGEFSFER
jgi:hypothetical protein